MKRRGNTIWLILVFAYAINFFHSLSMGVVKSDIIEEFGINESTFIGIGNMYANLYLIMQIPAGLLVDFLGGRKTAFFGMLFAAVGVSVFGMAQTPELLYLGRGLVGLGTSVLFVCILKIQASWFSPAVFGTMTGWTCFVGTLGGAFAQSPLAILTGAIGWRAAFLGVGVLSFAVAVAILLFVRNTPGELGFSPEGWEAPEPDRKRNGGEVVRGILAVVLNRRTWPIFFSYAAFYGSYVVLMGYYGLSYIAEAYQKSPVAASLCITAGVVGSAVGAAVIGSLSDRLQSRKKPLVWAGLGYAACWAALAFFSEGIPEWAMAPFLFVIGFLSCAYVVSWPAAKEVNDASFMGISTSVANIGGFFGSILIPLLAGQVFEAGGASSNAYGTMFMLIAALVLLGVVSSAFVTETNCKNIYVGNHSNK